MHYDFFIVIKFYKYHYISKFMDEDIFTHVINIPPIQ